MPFESRTAAEIVAWCTSSPIYLASFVRVLLSVGVDARNQNLLQKGRPFIMRVYKSNPPGRKTGFSDRWRRLSGEVPQKSAFEQVHRVASITSRTWSKPRYFGNFAAHFTLRSCQLTLRLPVNLQNPRKIVPKGRPLEVPQSAEKRRWN